MKRNTWLVILILCVTSLQACSVGVLGEYVNKKIENNQFVRISISLRLDNSCSCQKTIEFPAPVIENSSSCTWKRYSEKDIDLYIDNVYTPFTYQNGALTMKTTGDVFERI